MEYDANKRSLSSSCFAVKAVGIPTVEVHVSDPDSREEFRHVSYIRAACVGTVRGHGLPGYLEALRMLAQ